MTPRPTASPTGTPAHRGVQLPIPAFARMARRTASLALAGGLAVAALSGLASAPAAQAATYPTPPTPKFTLPAEASVAYEGQIICDPVAKPGVVAFQDLVLKTYPNTGSSGIVRPCDVGGRSEHKEGRAWDWRVNVANARESGQAGALLSWLTKNDAEMARRLGIMYIVWNDRIFGTYNRDDGWRPYVHSACRTVPLAKCSPTLRHRDHVHFSFTWSGALKHTSFYGRRPSPNDVPTPPAPKPLATPTSLAPFQGTQVRPGASGEPVVAIQKALRMTLVDGDFGPKTTAAVVSYKRDKRLPVDGVVGPRTWKALEADLRYHAKKIAAVDDILLKPGARHARAVPVLERAIRVPGDSYYGPTSTEHVKAFQRYHDLPETGVVDWKTWQALRTL